MMDVLVWLKLTPDDWRKVIVSDESTFYVLKRTDQCKIWRLEKEKLLSECIQQANTGDDGKVGIWGGISGFGATAAKIYMEYMDGKLYCDVLQHQLKHSMAQIPKNAKIIFQQDLAPWHTSNVEKEKIAKLKLDLLDWAPKS